MKLSQSTLLLSVCVVLATLPGSRSRSGDFTVSVRTSPTHVSLTANSDGTTAVDLISPTSDHIGRIDDDGMPALPYRIVQVLLPHGSEFRALETTASSWETISGGDFRALTATREIIADIRPRQTAPKLIDASASAFPGQAARYLGTGVWHGRTIASFAVFPLRVSAGELNLAKEVELTIRTASADEASHDVAHALRLTRSQADGIEKALTTTVVNPEAAVTYPEFPRTAAPRGGFNPTVAPSLEGSPVAYVIITTDALAASYQRLADWRTARGMPAVVRTTDWIEQNYRHGSDIQETIRTFIRDAYEKWGTTFFLLGGDTEQVPPRYLYTTYYYGGTDIPADIYFQGLDGTWNDNHNGVFGENPADNPDVYAEAYVNRLPTSSVADVDLMTDKIINYETAHDPTYQEKMLYLAEVLFPTPWSPGMTIGENGATIAEFLYTKNVAPTDMEVVRLYETDYLFPGSLPESRAAAIDAMNSGYNHIFHIGHGYRFNLHVADLNITIPDADALTNDNRFFNLYMLNCTANAFDFDCLGEHFLMNPSGGAVSAVGASNSAFATAATYYMDAYTETVFADDVVRIGQAHTDSRVTRAPIAVLGDNADYWTHLIYVSLSDPALQMFTGPTEVLTVSHPDTITTGVSTFDVTVTADGSPQDSAVVCLWKGTEDYQIQTTDGLGVASFTFTSESPGSLSVVVTGLNLSAHRSAIWAVPDTSSVSAYLAFAGAAVDDDSVGGTFGNGDGVIDAGETVDLTPQATNTGDAPSLAATMTLSSGGGLVTILDPVASVGAAAVGQTLAAGDAWRISVSLGADDETVAEFDVNTNDGVGNWNDAFARVLHAPVLEFTTTRVDDSVLGNNDGIIQDLEQFHLYYAVKNYGTGAAYGLDAVLADASGGMVTVSSGTAAYPDVGAHDESENTVGFVASEVSTLTENTISIVVTDRFGRSVSDTFELRAPDPPTNLSFDASLGLDRIEVRWDAGPSTDVDRYHVHHSTIPGGPYTRATSDAVLHSVFTDTGLNANTRYYFVVTSIDTSGNESVPSAESSASTNPQQSLGWPNVTSSPTVSSPIVGDIDGDNDLEIILGNDLLYAWHHDGQEVRDGDGEALTYGVFSDAGAGYLGSVALAKIDDDFGLDIIAASWSTYEVYVFNQSGAVLPGWPRPTISHVRANMVVGDLDGDGDPEIVTVDEDAYLYAWNADGSEYRDGDNNPATDGVFYRLPDTPWWQYQSPCMADLDHDNKDEIIIGTQDSAVYILKEDGSALPGWPRTLNSFAGGGIAIGDIDNNGDLDLVVPTRNTGEIMALRPDNTILWIRWFAQNLFFNPSPALADIDGNGTLETFLPASSGMLYGVASNGADLPGWPVVYSTTTHSESSPIIADVTGDGIVDILLGDEGKFINGWDVNGQPLDGFPLVTQDAMRSTPAVADLDRDGTVEIVAAGYDRIVYVWDLTASYDASKAPWPMRAANWHRNSAVGYAVPTAAADVAFAHEVRGGELLAWWDVPLELGSRFDVDRAVVSEGIRGGFARVATELYSFGGRVEMTDHAVKMGETYIYRLMPEDGSEGILSNQVRIPVSRAAMEQNYPNPFNPTTTIVYYVPDGSSAPQPISLTVYDVTGARVRTLVDADVAPGRYALTWDGTNDTGNRVGSGVYFYRVVQPGFTATKKMVLLK